MADILFRRVTLRDLRQIGHHIAIDDAAAADRFRNVVVRRINMLRQFPESARPRPEIWAGHPNNTDWALHHSSSRTPEGHRSAHRSRGPRSSAPAQVPA